MMTALDEIYVFIGESCGLTNLNHAVSCSHIVMHSVERK